MTINQLVSEIAHAVGQPNNIPLRRNIKGAIIHTRNELIRRSYENHSYVDKGLMQTYRAALKNVVDGDINGLTVSNGTLLKRTVNKVPKPIRLTNNLPFNSIRTVGHDVKLIARSSSHMGKMYSKLIGFKNNVVYDYVNDYIYIVATDCSDTKHHWFNTIDHIFVEAAFERPELIPVETMEYRTNVEMYNMDNDEELDNNEYLIPEDMIGNIKEIIFKRNLLDVPRETNEVPKDNLVK